MILTRNAKITWTITLSATLVAVLAGMVAVFGHFVVRFPPSPFSIHPFATRWTGATVEKQVTQTYPAVSGQVVALSVPLGKVTVEPTRGAQQVQVVANLQVARVAGQSSADLLKQVDLTSAVQANSRTVSLLFPNGLLRQADLMLRVPAGTMLRIDNNLGQIEVNDGTYKSLQLHDDMGAINVSADVSDTLSLHSNMGAISFLGQLAASSNVVDNMGSIAITDTSAQAIHYQLDTNLGQASIKLPSAHVSERGNKLSGSTPGSKTPVVSLTCTNNLGSIIVQGE